MKKSTLSDAVMLGLVGMIEMGLCTAVGSKTKATRMMN
jgi:hypothetical protein